MGAVLHDEVLHCDRFENRLNRVGMQRFNHALRCVKTAY